MINCIHDIVPVYLFSLPPFNVTKGAENFFRIQNIKPWKPFTRWLFDNEDRLIVFCSKCKSWAPYNERYRHFDIVCRPVECITNIEAHKMFSERTYQVSARMFEASFKQETRQVEVI